MLYGDIIRLGLVLPKKEKYTMRDVQAVQVQSLFQPVEGSTLTLKQSAFIVKWSAIYHDTEYSRAVAPRVAQTQEITR